MSIPNKFRAITLITTFVVAVGASAAEKAPAVLGAFLTPDENVRGEIVVVLPPKEIQDYINIVKVASEDNPEWFKEYSEKAKPGIPLPYDEKLGLTKDQYQKYRKLWDQREFKVVQPVGLRLETADGKWRVKVTGAGARLSLLRYDPKGDVVISTNGRLERIEEIDAPAESILGAWKGHEWKFEEETGLGKTKENFAIGRTADKKFGLIVYRLQDISSSGRQLFDESMVIRFAKSGAK